MNRILIALAALALALPAAAADKKVEARLETPSVADQGPRADSHAARTTTRTLPSAVGVIWCE